MKNITASNTCVRHPESLSSASRWQKTLSETLKSLAHMISAAAQRPPQACCGRLHKKSPRSST